MSWGIFRRAPDFLVIQHNEIYLRRWYVLPRNKWIGLYLHEFLKSDDDRALHDHPYLFNISFLLSGSYLEHLPNGEIKVRRKWRFAFRWGKSAHMVQLRPQFSESKTLDGVSTQFRTGEKPVWTLFLTGPRVREWGFYCPNGRWVPWKEFVRVFPGGNAFGKGCGD